MDRRHFLRLGVGSAALLAAQPILGRDPALAQPAPGPFGHGVASGDPLPDRVILWTRITPSEDATPGSGLGAPTEVAWDVATDETFGTIVRSGTATTDPASDHTVKVDADGLPAGTELWYRFRALGATSPLGRTRTAPATDAEVAALRIGLVSCSNYEGGFFSAYRHLAARDDLDIVFHLGDYIYEYGQGGYGPGPAIGRLHDPATEMVSLSDYRRRYALYRTDPDLLALHQRYAFVTTLDDHEVTDNSWSDGAGNHGAGEGDYHARRSDAYQAHFEWMPIRPTGGGDEPTRIYRSSSFGSLADVFVLDERTYRSQQVEGLSEDRFVIDAELASPDRTMLGADQLAWFEDGLARSTAAWKLVVNPVMFAPFILADLPDLGGVGPLLTTVLNTLGATAPFVLNGDQWDGYAAEQAHLRERFAQTDGVVILTGDIHSSWAAEVPADPGTYLPGVGGESVAVEFVLPGVTSDALGPGLADVLPGGAGAVLADNLPAIVGLVATWFKYVDAERHGFGVLEVTGDHVQHQWFYVSDRTDPQASLVPGPSYRSTRGSNALDQAAALGPRTDRATPVEPAPATTATPPTTVGGATIPATGRAIPIGAAAGAAALGLAVATVARRAALTSEEPQ